jgi:hypothetical protein
MKRGMEMHVRRGFRCMEGEVGEYKRKCLRKMERGFEEGWKDRC